MGTFKKHGLVEKRAGLTPDMDLINAQALVELKAEDVFVFRVAACDDQLDRDHERFTLKTLEGLADLYVGRPIILDHQWSAKGQTARIYEADVQESGGVNRLVLSAYMLRNEVNAPAIQAIEGGILREVSVGCAIQHAVCSICGTDKAVAWCEHRPGKDYDGETCVVDLDGAADAYEVSFVAVPAQPGAGVTKTYGGEENRPQTNPNESDLQKALALLELEKNRFV